MTEYREGNEGVAQLRSKKEDQPEGEQAENEGNTQEMHETAVLLVLTSDGRLEAATQLPSIPMRRQATLRDVRDICHAMYSDIQVTLVGKASAHESSAAIQRTLAQSQIKNMQKKI